MQQVSADFVSRRLEYVVIQQNYENGVKISVTAMKIVWRMYSADLPRNWSRNGPQNPLDGNDDDLLGYW